MNVLEQKPPSIHPVESAGRLMEKAVPIVKTTDTVGDIEQLVKKGASSFASVSYIYVVDGHNVLKGVLSIKELFRFSKSEHVSEVMVKELVTVRAHTDQERVALIALRQNIKAVPVVDKEGILLGVVLTDAILNVLHSESVEDALRMVGAGKLTNPAYEIITAGVWMHFRKRLPWLLLGLAGGIGAAFVVRFFEEALAHQIILAAFIPAVVYMADAVGAQTQTIFVRSMALTRTLNLFSYVVREIKVALMLAVVLGLVSFVFTAFWLSSIIIGLVFGLSIILTIIAAMIIALFIPWLLVKFNYDPAIASGPFATVVRDITSLFIYFGIASIIF
jgi:magnesium transporter